MIFPPESGRSRSREVEPLSVRPDTVPTMLNSGDHIGVDPVGIFVHVEGFVSPRDTVAPELRPQGRLDVVLEGGVGIAARINEPDVPVRQAWRHLHINEV